MATINPTATITPNQLDQARVFYEEIEPRGLAYRGARDIIRRAEEGLSDLSPAEAVGMLLLSWNANYYRFRGRFGEDHQREIDGLLRDWQADITVYRDRALEGLEDDEDGIVDLFDDFASVLGPTGAAKALHVLAPRFFPLWDSGIQKGYRIRRTDGEGYLVFMLVTRDQCLDLGGEAVWGDALVKRIDEYNYCRYTRGLKMA
jgi:hypothetical protein